MPGLLSVGCTNGSAGSGSSRKSGISPRDFSHSSSLMEQAACAPVPYSLWRSGSSGMIPACPEVRSWSFWGHFGSQLLLLGLGTGTRAGATSRTLSRPPAPAVSTGTQEGARCFGAGIPRSAPGSCPAAGGGDAGIGSCSVPELREAELGSRFPAGDVGSGSFPSFLAQDALPAPSFKVHQKRDLTLKSWMSEMTRRL